MGRSLPTDRSDPGPRGLGLKDKTCWFCSDFSAFWCGKVGILVDGSHRGGWAKRDGCVATFRLCCAGKSVLKLVGTNYEVGEIVLLVGRLSSADGAATVRNERRDPWGSRLCRLPGHREGVGTPARRGALLCLCERIVRA